MYVVSHFSEKKKRFLYVGSLATDRVCVLNMLKYLCFAAQGRKFDGENAQPRRTKEMPKEDGIELSGGKSKSNLHNLSSCFSLTYTFSLNHYFNFASGECPSVKTFENGFRHQWSIRISVQRICGGRRCTPACSVSISSVS